MSLGIPKYYPVGIPSESQFILGSPKHSYAGPSILPSTLDSEVHLGGAKYTQQPRHRGRVRQRLQRPLHSHSFRWNESLVYGKIGTGNPHLLVKKYDFL